MDVNKLLKSVYNLNDYISATQEVINKYSNSKIQFNMSTVLSLKKIRSLEIEYFNKCDESGAGIKILELMLRLPPSKTWSLLGKELVLLIQYWLEAIRKHLILHNNHWWNFLSTLLKFIQDIRSKHTVLSNILVQDLSECLLDLATKCEPNVDQRLKLLQCYNSVCAESSRETRYALRNKLETYFVKLSSILPLCGDMRAQYSIMETLLRWLVPRQDAEVKLEAAAKWFPQNLYNETTRRIFIERPWQNFFKDAREFLNAQNMNSDVVTTVICRTFCIGNVTLISGTDKDYYLDLNASTEVISLMVEPSLSDVLGTSICNAVCISKDNTNSIRMYQDSSRVLVSVDIVDPQRLYPSPVLEERDIQIVVSSRSNLVKLNRALRHIFDTKYELLMDLENPPPASPLGVEGPGNNNISKDTRFSNAVQSSKLKRSGCTVRPMQPASWKSPSTASTSSLALLRDKLTAFPCYKFVKEPISVCALPQLSSVTELTEDDRYSFNATLSTYKLRTYGVCNKKYEIADRTSQSDKGGNICTTPINFDENSISCLLVATIGSNDSVINDTLDRLPKDKEVHTDNIVELLAKEALHSNDPKLHSGILTTDKTYSEVNSDVIEDTQQPNTFINEKNDQLAYEIVKDIHCVSNLQGSNEALGEKSIINVRTNEQTNYDIQAVEDLFSQHRSLNENGDSLINPALANKINQTSSESSLDFEIRTPIIDDIETNQYYVHFNVDNAEIIECLNDMVDRVCANLGISTDYMSKGIEHLNVCDKVKEFCIKTPSKEIQDMAKSKKEKLKKNTRLKLQFKNTRTRNCRAKKQNKLEPENIKRMTTIIEKDSDVDKTFLKNSSLESNSLQLNDYESPLLKRKRKLYSPKDDNALNEKSGIHISETEDDYSVLTGTRNWKVNKTSRTLATSYKDIEKIRRRSARNLRIRKSVINLSPRTKKNNDIFDNLKKTVDGEEITLADKKINSRNKNLAVYNFSSDSEDDDFQKKKEVKKCANAVRSLESATHGRKSSQEKKNKNVKRGKNKSNLKQQISFPKNEMIDERVRETVTEALNSSIVIEKQHDSISKALEPIIHETPQMEIIVHEKDSSTRKITRRKRPTMVPLNKSKVSNKDKNISSDKEPSVRSSPLPGLIIETVQVQIHKDPEDSITVSMLEKFKDIYNNEPLPDISEINTTHNLLSDLEQITYDSNLNITEEFNMINTSNPDGKRLRNEIINNCPRSKKSKLGTSNVGVEIEPLIITLSKVSDDRSEKSISTLVKSPITGHGDFDESPPNTDQLKQRYEPRRSEMQDFNQSIKDFFNDVTKDIYEVSKSSTSEIIVNKTINAKELKMSPIKLIKDMSNLSPTVSITRLSPIEIGRWLPPRKNSIFGSNQSSEKDHPVRITRSHTRSQGKLRKIGSTTTTTKSSKINLRKSAISPIKMFGEVSKEKSVTSENNDYVKELKSILTRKCKILNAVNTKSISSTYELEKCSSKTQKCHKPPSSINSSNVEYSKDTKRASPAFKVAKKKKITTNISDFESDHSSCIKEWFKKNEQQRHSRAESADLSSKDILENTIEKLETTLTEIHHKTSKKFVSMFVDAQRQLTDLKEKRRQLYKQTALEVISDIVTVMDAKFGELERRSQDLDRQFLDGLKEEAGDVIRADCSQKRVLVSLLREDVRTVLNQFSKDGETN